MNLVRQIVIKTPREDSVLWYPTEVPVFIIIVFIIRGKGRATENIPRRCRDVVVTRRDVTHRALYLNELVIVVALVDYLHFKSTS